MPMQKTATLATIFSEVLADLAFMFTDEEDWSSPSDDAWLETTICYQGAANGRLQFRCPREFTRRLASNLLGIEPEKVRVPDDADDAVKEFMNIVCGQLVTTVHGTEDVFNLTIPTVETMVEPPDCTLDDGINVSTLSVEGFRVQLAYQPGP